MLQLCWNPSERKAEVLTLPPPHVEPGFVRVRNAFSAISAGTEKSNTELSLAHPFKLMRERPDLVLKVKRLARTQGLRRTWEMVQNRMGVRQAVGYSCAGVVDAVGDDWAGLSLGDRVACMGFGYAVHAEQVLVPYNLCVRVPAECSLEAAATGAIGTIAMQAFRLAQATVGERVLVIGLGLVGQLCGRIALAAGCCVVGLDPDEFRGRCLLAQGAETVWTPAAAPSVDTFDAVIVAAASDSSEPLATAGRLARSGGRVIATGLFPLELPRDLYYHKQLQFIVSRSTGPGRYDPSYEELGLDYPAEHVRWTEQRNLSSYLDLIARERVHVTDLITHRFDITDGVRAYEQMRTPAAEQLGLLFRYPEAESTSGSPHPQAVSPCPRIRQPCIAMFGAGRFARSVLLPALAKIPLQREAICTRRPLEGRAASEQFGFARQESEPSAIMNDHRVDAVLIATRHDSHASLVCDALAAGKAVFVEKPLAITLRELARVEKGLQAPGARLLVGFNRRFAPLSEALRRHFAGNENRLVIQYRINAGYLPPDDWTQVPAIGGGRIVGEACHFVDWISYLTDSMPVAVYAAQRHGARDEVLITLTMENGSLAVITYVAGGSPAQPKERIEVFGAGKSAVLEDWRWADLMSGAKRKRIRKPGKGHQEELAAWVTGLQHGAAMPITPASLLRTTAATLAVERSLTERRAIDLIQERGMDSPPANAPVVLL